jgi:hypothetical protein
VLPHPSAKNAEDGAIGGCTIFAVQLVEVSKPMKDYISSRFSVGDVVRNKRTNEDGKIDNVVIDDDCNVRYSVHIPTDSYGWEMGTREADVLWDENEISASPNHFLK